MFRHPTHRFAAKTRRLSARSTWEIYCGHTWDLGKWPSQLPGLANVGASGRLRVGPSEEPVGGVLRASSSRLFRAADRIVLGILIIILGDWAAFQCPHPTWTAPIRRVLATAHPRNP